MKKAQIFIILFIFVANAIFAQKKEATNSKIILITLDGLRWQELFTGADPLLINNKNYVKDTTGLKLHFWKKTTEERRQALMPFIWSEVLKNGQIHGNRNLGSKVDLTNKMWFSYPGYNEILTGNADDKNITSNDKINNPNKTILEIANSLPQYKGKIAAFGSWDVFPYIVNEERSGIPVNAGFELAIGNNLSDREHFLNQLQPKVPSPWVSVRLDAFTHYYALEYMKKEHPELIYIAYGETDDFAHDGEYDSYLKSARNTDSFIEELWDFTQEDKFYKDNTIFIITTDHGRGTEPLDTWKSHGSNVVGANQTWLIVFGNGVKILGEIKENEQIYSNQIAPTILELLNLKIASTKMEGQPLSVTEK